MGILCDLFLGFVYFFICFIRCIDLCDFEVYDFLYLLRDQRGFFDFGFLWQDMR